MLVCVCAVCEKHLFVHQTIKIERKKEKTKHRENNRFRADYPNNTTANSFIKPRNVMMMMVLCGGTVFGIQ